MPPRRNKRRGPSRLWMPEPAPAQDICDWVEGSVIVTTGGRPGYVRIDPYQREPLWKTTQGGKVVLMWSSQLGKSIIAGWRIGWSIDQFPEQIYLMHASDKGLAKFLREKIKPMFQATPRLRDSVALNNRGEIPPEGFGFGRGGYCTFAVSGGRTDAHGSTASCAIGDELNDWNPMTGVANLVQRTAQTPFANILLISTPGGTVQNVAPEYYGGTQKRWEIKCPHCPWRGFWEREHVKREIRRLACLGCGGFWTELQRRAAIRAGRWVAQNPGAPYESYQLSQIYSLGVSFEKTLDDTENYGERDFVTEVMAWPFDEQVIEPVLVSEIKRCSLPFTPVLVCAGVDVQGGKRARLEYGVLAIGPQFVKKHILAHGVVARTDDYSCMNELRRQLAQWKVERIAIDGAFDFEWVRAGVDRAFADALLLENPPVEVVRGYSGVGKSFDKPLRGAHGKEKAFLNIAVDEAKVQVTRDLKSGALTVDESLAEASIQQLTSERLVRVQVGQQLQRRWIHDDSIPNELLDCTGMGYCTAVGADLEPTWSPELRAAKP